MLSKCLCGMMLAVCAADVAAQTFTLDARHLAQVNRQRRIFTQYDPAIDVLHEGGFGSDIGRVMEYVFAYADQPGSQLDAICIDVSNEGVAHYRSKLLPAIQHRGLVKWRQEGIDYFDRFTQEGHRRGKEIWWGLRMNEVERGHQNGLDNTSVTMAEQSPVKAAHPDWLIRSWWWQGFWNYAVPDVREYRLKLIEEVVQQYDFDGVHLDFLRHTPHLAPGPPWKLRHHLTRFLADVRTMLQKRAAERGRPILLAVRVPDSVAGANNDGLDVETWAQLRLVDVMVLGTRTIDVDVASFKRATTGTPVKLIPSFDSYHATDGYQGTQPIELLRGVFGNYWHQGADSVGMFNQPAGPPEHGQRIGIRRPSGGIQPTRASIAQAISTVGSIETIAGQPRFYALDRRSGYLFGEGYFSSNLGAPLPVALRNDESPARLTLPVWEPVKTGTDVRLRVVADQAETRDPGVNLPADRPPSDKDEFAATLNGVALKLDTYDPGWKDSRLYSPKPQPETITYDTINRDTEHQRLLRLEFIVPAEALKRGANEIAVSVRRTGAFPPRKFVSVEKVELHLK
jgi:hypothetical protein